MLVVITFSINKLSVLAGKGHGGWRGICF